MGCGRRRWSRLRPQCGLIRVLRPRRSFRGGRCGRGYGRSLAAGRTWRLWRGDHGIIPCRGHGRRATLPHLRKAGCGHRRRGGLHCGCIFLRSRVLGRARCGPWGGRNSRRDSDRQRRRQRRRSVRRCRWLAGRCDTLRGCLRFGARRSVRRLGQGRYRGRLLARCGRDGRGRRDGRSDRRCGCSRRRRIDNLWLANRGNRRLCSITHSGFGIRLRGGWRRGFNDCLVGLHGVDRGALLSGRSPARYVSLMRRRQRRVRQQRNRSVPI